MGYKQITGDTLEHKLESIDAHIDVLTRKPRKTIEVTINQTPAGCQLRNVIVGEMLGVGFYVTAGSLKNFKFISPSDVRNLCCCLIRSKDSQTVIDEISLTGNTDFETIIEIEAGTEVFLQLKHLTVTEVAFLTAGFVFEPKGV